MRTGIWAIVALVLGLIFAAGCGGDGPKKSGAKKRIAVVPKSSSHEFWKTLHVGAKTAAAESGAEIYFKAGEPEDDAKGQIELVERLVGQYDAIVLAPVHSKFLAQVVGTAKDKKVPLVIVDSGVDAPAEDYAAYIATDNRAGGAACAKKMGELLGGKGEVLMLKYMAGSASTAQREDGFRETLNKEFPNIKIIQEKYGEANRDTALQNATQLFQAQPKFDGIFACNESTTFGAMRALEEAGLAGKVKFVGFDCAKEFLTAMDRGVIHALAVQDPYRMGYEGVLSAVAALEGKSVTKTVDTGVVMVDKGNVKDAKIQKIVNPPLE